jgi:hypothetical protein
MESSDMVTMGLIIYTIVQSAHKQKKGRTSFMADKQAVYLVPEDLLGSLTAVEG